LRPSALQDASELAEEADVTAPLDDLIPVVDRLEATYGPERRLQIEETVMEAWLTLRSISDHSDRIVTAEYLARIELTAMTHARALSAPPLIEARAS